MITLLKDNYITGYNKHFRPSFTAIERTFGMLKPDAFERSLDSVIVKEIEKNDFKILNSLKERASREKLEKNYLEHKDKPFFNEWMDFMQSSYVQGMVIEGENAITRFREFSKQIREKFAPGEKRRNLIHSSDSPDAAARELENFFRFNEKPALPFND